MNEQINLFGKNLDDTAIVFAKIAVVLSGAL